MERQYVHDTLRCNGKRTAASQRFTLMPARDSETAHNMPTIPPPIIATEKSFVELVFICVYGGSLMRGRYENDLNYKAYKPSSPSSIRVVPVRDKHSKTSQQKVARELVKVAQRLERIIFSRNSNLHMICATSENQLAFLYTRLQGRRGSIRGIFIIDSKFGYRDELLRVTFVAASSHVHTETSIIGATERSRILATAGSKDLVRQENG